MALSLRTPVSPYRQALADRPYTSKPLHLARSSVRAASASGQAEPVYQGRFGAWRIEQEDIVEVWGYRAGISVAAVTALAASSSAFLPPGEARDAVAGALDPLCLVGAAGLGASLQLIHIYITPLKRALQALWLAGTLGAVYLMLTQDAPAALFVAENRWAVWLVGPLFASLTGVAFKEGFCYGKWEAGGLFGVLPLLLLGHLSGLVPEDGEKGMLVAFDIIFAVFAARKYTQPIKDDIGDKSVFEFMKLPAEEQEARMRAMGLRDD
uniref:Uncharacterized protein n=1 Tax=Chlamydomonas leiostraca TaxID=1034604 RepID=A0A7S0RZ94_9CHLO|mmetsp:Transcript_35301/g.89354  ORF Transcript_35301/g.89354 Transcript_35301/m.89354 type:complete len:267 (+) Transcript_35301:27-827(+)